MAESLLHGAEQGVHGLTVGRGEGSEQLFDECFVRTSHRSEMATPGRGESHHGRAHTAVAKLIETTLKRLVLGMDASDVVGVWAKIYKMQLDGTIVGRIGRAGKQFKEFGMVNSIDCREPNTLYVGELMNWRVQKLTLK